MYILNSSFILAKLLPHFKARISQELEEKKRQDYI
jgi:hypothetical protein